MPNYRPAVLSLLTISACSKNDTGVKPDDPSNTTDPIVDLYFPPAGSSDWETVSIAALNWDPSAQNPLKELLQENKTKAFIILKDGKLAVEEYFGAFTVGIAREKNLLNIDHKSSRYLGESWTSASREKEDLITIWHQLTMTSGLKDTSFDCVTPDCLEYLADAGTRWAYHNGPYTLLQSVVSSASQTTWSAFFNTHLRNKIGMNGLWVSTNGANNVYFSNARSMARFGLLNLNNGTWDNELILEDINFISQMKNTSQNLNKSYGYLWWLNGKESYMAPVLQATFNGELIPNAPEDTYSGLGKNDQKLYVVPSKGLVVVRMGEDTGESLLGPSSFDNELWEKINDLIE